MNTIISQILLECMSDADAEDIRKGSLIYRAPNGRKALQGGRSLYASRRKKKKSYVFEENQELSPKFMSVKEKEFIMREVLNSNKMFTSLDSVRLCISFRD